MIIYVLCKHILKYLVEFIRDAIRTSRVFVYVYVRVRVRVCVCVCVCVSEVLNVKLQIVFQ